jgi:hypothetical protein
MPEDNALWTLRIGQWFAVDEKKLIGIMLVRGGFISHFDDNGLRGKRGIDAIYLRAR